MNVDFSDDLKAWGEGFALAQKGTKRLIEVIGPDRDVVAGEWDCVTDESGQQILTLHVFDHAGETTFSFAPDELISPSQTSFRMHRLWGDVLHARSGRILDNLAAAGGGRES